MTFPELISVYRNVFLVFCPRILFYYDISVTLFCVQKSFSSRPRNVILRHHNYIEEVVSYLNILVCKWSKIAKKKKIVFSRHRCQTCKDVQIWKVYKLNV